MCVLISALANPDEGLLGMGAPFAADVNLVDGNEAGAGETRVSQLEAVDAGGVGALVDRVLSGVATYYVWYVAPFQ